MLSFMHESLHYNIFMLRIASCALFLVASFLSLGAQSAPGNPPANPAPPRSDQGTPDSDSGPAAPVLKQRPVPRSSSDASGLPTETGAGPNDSSSRSTMVDISPPPGDRPDDESASDNSGVNEMKPWNPHRAAKDIEVGDYYFKEKNYVGAEARYRDALEYKPNDAVATYKMAVILEKTNRICQARKYYESYLKILPSGPYAKDSRQALDKLPQATEPCPDNPGKASLDGNVTFGSAPRP